MTAPIATMAAPAELCTIRVSDVEVAIARQRWNFGCNPAGTLEAYLFEGWDAEQEAAP